MKLWGGRFTKETNELVNNVNASISFGGTSLIIIVGVIIETLKQIESRMLVRNYKGFLND